MPGATACPGLHTLLHPQGWLEGRSGLPYLTQWQHSSNRLHCLGRGETAASSEREGGSGNGQWEEAKKLLL